MVVQELPVLRETVAPAVMQPQQAMLERVGPPVSREVAVAVAPVDHTVLSVIALATRVLVKMVLPVMLDQAVAPAAPEVLHTPGQRAEAREVREVSAQLAAQVILAAAVVPVILAQPVTLVVPVEPVVRVMPEDLLHLDHLKHFLRQ